MKRFVLDVLRKFLFFSAVGTSFFSFAPLLQPRFRYFFDRLEGRKYRLSLDQATTDENGKLVDKQLQASETLALVPINRQFSLIIEKINLNAPIIANVSVSNEREYQRALQRGVAHAKGSALPGEGNTYLFAHSSLEFWKLGKYATIFNLLDRLERGDLVYVLYKGDLFSYRVAEKGVYPKDAVALLRKQTDVPTLFLQTCYPLGTSLKRLVVEAKLIS